MLSLQHKTKYFETRSQNMKQFNVFKCKFQRFNRAALAFNSIVIKARHTVVGIDMFICVDSV